MYAICPKVLYPKHKVSLLSRPNLQKSKFDGDRSFTPKHKAGGFVVKNEINCHLLPKFAISIYAQVKLKIFEFWI